MDAISTMLLGFAILRGEHVPQGELPYLDGLPLDLPNRTAIYWEFRRRVATVDKQCESSYWKDRHATRLYLRTLAPMDAAYMYGRLMGRHFNWCAWLREDGQIGRGWIDEEIERLSKEPAPELLPEPKQGRGR